jgi:hypothetical protein
VCSVRTSSYVIIFVRGMFLFVLSLFVLLNRCCLI